MFPALHCQPGEKRKIQLRLIGKREKSPINLISPVRIGSKLAILNVRSVEAVISEERCHVFLSVDPHKITPSKRLAIAEHTQLEVRDFFLRGVTRSHDVTKFAVTHQSPDSA